VDVGWFAMRTGAGGCRELLGRLEVGGREATVKACGVAVAMSQGQSRAPRLSIGER
jgi:hypothetical protein